MNNSQKIEETWRRAKQALEQAGLYTLEETKALLLKDDYWKSLEGKAKNRTLLKENPKLYNSVYLYSKPLEDKMKESSRYASTYNFSHRLRFIVEYNADIEKLRCACGKRYSWTGHCRACSPCSDLTKEERSRRAEKARLTWRIRIGKELSREGKSPRYDLESIKILNRFAEEHDLNLRHAEKGGEVFLKDLGYWLDGYDSEKNILVEIDEPFHFRKDLILGDRDIRRHREIQEKLGCSVYRIYFNKRTNRVVLYNTPENPNNWKVNEGKDLTEVEKINANGTKQYRRY